MEGLTAQKEALVQPYSTLEDQFKGKSGEVATRRFIIKGGSSSGGFTSRVTPRNDESQPDFYLKTAT